ncbi:uncharacterized protein LOC110974933 isoform X2 [Acanthaster planci]|uniref:Uncharacterized protein LOC110974933 isoform X2 n=1 Tax=Acanthaster planci TaxID=133434 RepID=A0A8B7XP62_ACAPL|nr:uncharacterized protein LOC110974933 isoform X2 [Acanthaster planci]
MTLIDVWVVIFRSLFEETPNKCYVSRGAECLPTESTLLDDHSMICQDETSRISCVSTNSLRSNTCLEVIARSLQNDRIEQVTDTSIKNDYGEQESETSIVKNGTQVTGIPLSGFDQNEMSSNFPFVCKAKGDGNLIIIGGNTTISQHQKASGSGHAIIEGAGISTRDLDSEVDPPRRRGLQ